MVYSAVVSDVVLMSQRADKKRIRIKRYKILWLLFFCTGLKGKFVLSHPILKYSEASETVSGERNTEPRRATDAVGERHGSVICTDYIRSVLFFFRNNSMIGIENISADIIEGEQCYFSCKNGEYRMFIRDYL